MLGSVSRHQRALIAGLVVSVGIFGLAVRLRSPPSVLDGGFEGKENLELSGRGGSRGRVGGGLSWMEDEVPSLGDGLKAKSSKLVSVLHALEGATATAHREAEEEQSEGSSELRRARKAEQVATGFMGKADQLMASERALKQQQRFVKKELGEIADEHHNILAWASCREGPGCNGEQVGKDVWEKASTSPSSRDQPRDITSAVDPSGESEGAGGALSPSLHPGRVGIKPYSSSEWHDTKPVTVWQRVKPSVLRAGYDLSNCMVAAQKDTGVVKVKIVEKVRVPLTQQGCTCKMPWKFMREKDLGGQRTESTQVTTFERCSENGSPGEPWCAVEGDDCGERSKDPHSGHGKGQYGWTRWDYCDGNKQGWGHKTLWEASHSAGQVTCLAEFLITSDKALEWRALDLLRQQVVSDDAGGRQAPSEVASRYETCTRDAASLDSAVFCETDMLSHFSQSLVRHALLISRASALNVHWSNRQRVYLLYTLQFQSCINKARGKKEGEVCIAQLLSSMPHRLSHVAVSHALHTPTSPGAPKTVEVLASHLVMCMQAAADRDAASFCVATFLSHAPHDTTRVAAAMAERVRNLGSAGFDDVVGQLTNGWTGFRDIAQASNTHDRILG